MAYLGKVTAVCLRASRLLSLALFILFLGCEGKHVAETSDKHDASKSADRADPKAAQGEVTRDPAPTPPKPSDQDGPAEVVKKKYAAMMENDRKKFDECFLSTTNSDLLEAYYAAGVQAIAFKRSLQASYGLEGVSRFEDRSTAREAGMVLFQMPPLEKDDPWSDRIKWQMTDKEQAQCLDPFERNNFKMVRTNGVWQYDFTATLSMPEGAIANMRKFVRSLERCMGEIGKPGVTIDDLRRKLGAGDETPAPAAESPPGSIENTPEAQVNPKEMEVIAEIKKLGGAVVFDPESPGKHVIWVELAGTKVVDAELAHLKVFDTPVVSVDLSRTQVTDGGLSHLKGLSQLRYVHVAFTGITDAALTHFAELANLESLDLVGTNIGDTGLKHLKGLRKLQSLNLSLTKVTDAGLAYLKGFDQLSDLSLNRTEVTDLGLEQIGGLRQLESLALIRTKVTETGVKRIQEALPNCKIIVGHAGKD